MAIHIGTKIKEELYKQDIPVSVFARKINRSRNVIYNIFGRESIDTNLLEKIGEVLKIDFFSLYRGSKEYKPHSTASLQVKENREQYLTITERLERLEKRNKELEEDNEHLRKIVTLLEERVERKPAPKARKKK